MKSRLIYTAIFGDYDNVISINHKISTGGKECDYICFSDRHLDVQPPWMLNVISNDDKTPAELNRQLKFLGNSIVNTYQEVVYIDGNIELVVDPFDYIGELSEQRPLVMLEHSKRSDVTSEIVECVITNKISVYAAIALIIRQARNGYRFKGLLTENRMIARYVPSLRVNHLFEMVYKEYMIGPKRDQLHLQYILDKAQVPVALISKLQQAEIFNVIPHRGQDYSVGRLKRALKRVSGYYPLTLLFKIIATIAATIPVKGASHKI